MLSTSAHQGSVDEALGGEPLRALVAGEELDDLAFGRLR